MAIELELKTLNAHTLVIAHDGDETIVRIAKDGHNRAIAKLSPEDVAQLISALQEGDRK